MNYSNTPGIIIIALDLAAKELSQLTGEPHTQIKERLTLSAFQQFNQMTVTEVTKWVETARSAIFGQMEWAPTIGKTSALLVKG